MKHQILNLTVILCIAFATGCNNNGEEKKPGHQTTGIGEKITSRQVSDSVAKAAIAEYGDSCMKWKYNQNTSIRAWLINGQDVLQAMGFSQEQTDSIMRIRRRNAYPYIHAYIGLDQSAMGNQNDYLNYQLYIVGADFITINNVPGRTELDDFTQNGIFNLTMPCPSACAKVNPELYNAFDSGYSQKGTVLKKGEQ